MLLYFEFEEKRRKADVQWPKNDEPIIINITDKEIARQFPTDLFFNVDDDGKVRFEVEDIANKRLLELQNILRRRLQELMT